jgi:hypothetical protein
VPRSELRANRIDREICPGKAAARDQGALVVHAKRPCPRGEPRSLAEFDDRMTGGFGCDGNAGRSCNQRGVRP